MPPAVRSSFWLLVAGFVAGVAVAPFDPRPWPKWRDIPDPMAAVVTGLLLVGILIFIALRTYQGRNWARWVQLILLLAAVPSFLRDAGARLAVAPVVGFIDMLLFAAEVVCIGLLFTPTANRWYHRRSPE
ncbi:MAG TPA: hypothetical protein VGM97_17525 [Steroidobacteraceae bacterium]|jgi:hypothetical protein